MGAADTKTHPGYQLTHQSGKQNEIHSKCCLLWLNTKLAFIHPVSSQPVLWCNGGTERPKSRQSQVQSHVCLTPVLSRRSSDAVSSQVNTPRLETSWAHEESECWPCGVNCPLYTAHLLFRRWGAPRIRKGIPARPAFGPLVRPVLCVKGLFANGGHLSRCGPPHTSWWCHFGKLTCFTLGHLLPCVPEDNGVLRRIVFSLDW